MFWADLWDFLLAIWRDWVARVTGSTATALLAAYEHKVNKAVSWDVFAWGSIVFFFVGAFQAWRAERQKTRGKRRDILLADVLSRVQHVVTGVMGMSVAVADTHTIGAMIQCYADFGDETDVVWLGQEIEKLGNKGSDPFDGFEFIYGKNAFDGKRLKFLRDAYMNGGVYTDRDATLYLQSHWADANGLKEFDCGKQR